MKTEFVILTIRLAFTVRHPFFVKNLYVCEIKKEC